MTVDFLIGAVRASRDLHPNVKTELEEILNRQEAVEPLPQNSGGWIETRTLWYCGACHGRISKRTARFCTNCGRAVAWP